MNYSIRSYKAADFNEISSWWKFYNEHPPLEGMMVEDGTFVLEVENVSALSLTAFCTQSKEIAYFEGFIKNPIFYGYNLSEQGQALWNHCFQYLKDKNYKRVICYCKVEALKDKYRSFGMSDNLSGLSSFCKEL